MYIFVLQLFIPSILELIIPRIFSYLLAFKPSLLYVQKNTFRCTYGNYTWLTDLQPNLSWLTALKSRTEICDWYVDNTGTADEWIQILLW